MNYYDYPATAIIGSDGIVTGIDENWHKTSISESSDIFLQCSVDDNYVEKLITAAESHNVFAVKVLEGFESVLTEEFDSFEMDYYFKNGSGERLIRLSISPVNGIPDKIVVSRRQLNGFAG